MGIVTIQQEYSYARYRGLQIQYMGPTSLSQHIIVSKLTEHYPLLEACVRTETRKKI
jgi:hypothetical protein